MKKNSFSMGKYLRHLSYSVKQKYYTDASFLDGDSLVRKTRILEKTAPDSDRRRSTREIWVDTKEKR